MMKRPLGKTGFSIAPLALGGNVFGWTVDESAAFAILDAFTEYGLDLVDTANIYSTWVPGNRGGESEVMIGRWIKRSGKRDKILLATKVGKPMHNGTRGLGKAAILKSVEDSLTRLQTDHIDLYQSHEDDSGTPLEETLSVYDVLIRQGKVRAIGASNYSAERLRESFAVSTSMNLPAYSTLQPEYNLYARAAFESTLEPLVIQSGLGVLTYYSLASGFLTGKYRSTANLGGSVRGGEIGKKYLNARGFRILAALDALAATHQATPASIALAWLIHRPTVTAPIASATSVAQLDDLVQSLRITLSPEDIAQLDQASKEEGSIASRERHSAHFPVDCPSGGAPYEDEPPQLGTG